MAKKWSTKIWIAAMASSYLGSSAAIIGWQIGSGHNNCPKWFAIVLGVYVGFHTVHRYERHQPDGEE